MDYTMKILKSFLFLTLITCVQISNSSCLIKNCICITEREVHCNQVELTKIPPFTNASRMISRFYATGNNITTIEKDSFTALTNVKVLSLDRNNIETIKPFAFRGVVGASSIRVQNNPIKSLESNSFSGIKNIDVLLLDRNKIQIIRAFAFAASFGIRILLLEHNPIKIIESNAFTGLKNVDHIIFPSGIKVIEPYAFDGFENILLIRFQLLDLDELKPNTFNGLTDVKVIQFLESDLGVIKADAFKGISYVLLISFFKNKIDKIEELKLEIENEVENLKFVGNHFLEIPNSISLAENTSTIVRDNFFPCNCRMYSLVDGPLMTNMVNSSVNDFLSNNYCISPIVLNGLPLKNYPRCENSENDAIRIERKIGLIMILLIYNVI